MVVRERIATARESRIAKLRKAEKIVCVRGGAERQREQEAAAQARAQAHLKERGTVSRRGMDPESFTYAEKESYVRFAPFMGMRSCALEPRSEMQGCVCVARVRGDFPLCVIPLSPAPRTLGRGRLLSRPLACAPAGLGRRLRWRLWRWCCRSRRLRRCSRCCPCCCPGFCPPWVL